MLSSSHLCRCVLQVGDNYVGPNPGPNCGNWCIQGPVVDFRHSTDKGLTWHEVTIHSRQRSETTLISFAVAHTNALTRL